MSEPTQEIAAAAIEFINTRQKAADLKAKRAEMLAAEECERAGPPCYLAGLSMIAWCLRCRGVQPVHVQYRTTVARRTAALLKLKRLVKRAHPARA